MKLIIFEGIDQIGKSTLIRQVQQALTGRVSIVKDDIQLNTVNPIKQYFKNPHLFYEEKHVGYILGFINGLKTFKHHDEIILLDRFHWTAYAYSAVLRQNALKDVFISNQNFIDLNRALEKSLQSNFDTKLVTFLVNKEQANYIREDEVVSSLDLIRINNRFEEASEQSILNKKTFWLDYAEQDGQYLTDIMNTETNIVDFING
jgi:thymidylate kinase